MAQILLVQTDRMFDIPTLIANLVTIHGTNPISVLWTGADGNQPEIAAAKWAQSMGIPWLAKGHDMDTAGVNDPFMRAYLLVNKANPGGLLAAGVGPKVNSAHQAANGKKIPVTRL